MGGDGGEGGWVVRWRRKRQDQRGEWLVELASDRQRRGGGMLGGGKETKVGGGQRGREGGWEDRDGKGGKKAEGER